MHIVSVTIQGKSSAVAREFKWLRGMEGHEGDIDMPADNTILIVPDSTIACKVACDGDLEMLANPSGKGSLFAWKKSAQKSGSGSGEITVATTEDPDDPLTFSVELEDEATIEIDRDDAAKRHGLLSATNATGIDVIDRYGAYAVGLLGALGAVGFARLVPGWSNWLMGGAGGIAFWTFLCTDEYDAFGLRIVGFLVSALLMFIAIGMPDYATMLTTGAGAAATFAILCGDGDLDNFWF